MEKTNDIKKIPELIRATKFKLEGERKPFQIKNRENIFYWRSAIWDDKGNEICGQYIKIEDLPDSYIPVIERKIKSFLKGSSTLGHRVEEWTIRLNVEKKRRKAMEIKELKLLNGLFEKPGTIGPLIPDIIRAKKEFNNL